MRDITQGGRGPTTKDQAGDTVANAKKSSPLARSWRPRRGGEGKAVEEDAQGPHWKKPGTGTRVCISFMSPCHFHLVSADLRLSKLPTASSMTRSENLPTPTNKCHPKMLLAHPSSQSNPHVKSYHMGLGHACCRDGTQWTGTRDWS